MTLNPGADVFVPPSDMIKNLRIRSEESHSIMQSAPLQQQYPPPQLESLYIDSSRMAHPDEMFDEEQTPKPIDYSNIDLDYFFFDMVTADEDDFNNYHTCRAEYLQGYASISTDNTLTVIDSIFNHVRDLLWKTRSEIRHQRRFNHKRVLSLASAMVDMNKAFRETLIFRLLEWIEFIRCDNLWQLDPGASLTVFLILSELHIGSCIKIPQILEAYPKQLFELLRDLLRERQTTKLALEIFELSAQQLKPILGPVHISSLCADIERIRFHGKHNMHHRLLSIMNALRQPPPVNCTKFHALPVAQLSDEEDRAFEAFLSEQTPPDEMN